MTEEEKNSPSPDEVSSSVINSGKEFLIFHCPQGHQNVLPPDSLALEKPEMISVRCAVCQWQSPAFRPALFQYHLADQSLLWVYTSKETQAIQSFFHLSLPGSPLVALSPSTLGPVLSACPAAVDPAALASRPKTISEEKEEISSVSSAPAQIARAIEPPTTSVSSVKPAVLSSPTALAVEPPPSLAASPQNPQQAVSGDRPPIESVIVTPTAETPDDTVEIRRPGRTPTKSSVESTKNKQTLRLNRAALAARVSDPVGETAVPVGAHLRVRPPDVSPSALREQPSAPWPTSLKLRLPWGLMLFCTLTLAAVFVAASHFLREQASHFTETMQTSQREGTERLSGAIRLLQEEIARLELPDARIASPTSPGQLPQPSFATPPTEEIQRLQQEKSALLAKMQELQEKNQALYAGHQALSVSYQNLKKEAETASQNLQEFQRAREGSPDRTKEYETLLRAMEREFLSVRLNGEDRDFYTPLLAQSGGYLLYVDEQSENRLFRLALHLAPLRNNQVNASTVVFSTPPLRKREEGGAPLLCDWDGANQIALLTRIGGLNRITYLQLQLPAPGTGEVSVSSKTDLLSVQAPQILGPPALAARRRAVAFLHQKGDGSAWLTAYGLSPPNALGQQAGAAGTLMVPAWTPDEQTIAYPAEGGRSIGLWNLETQKSERLALTDSELYGRYFSWDPTGSKLAFFRRAPQQRGRVDLCCWHLPEKRLYTVVENLLTVETCQPQWSANGRFLCFIEGGATESLWMINWETHERFLVFRQKGKISWVQWPAGSPILFSYQEGLFTRPYLVYLVSLFHAAK